MTRQRMFHFDIINKQIEPKNTRHTMRFDHAGVIVDSRGISFLKLLVPTNTYRAWIHIQIFYFVLFALVTALPLDSIQQTP